MATIHFLNVGHGDCSIIHHNDGRLTMIDINNGDDLDKESASAILEQFPARDRQTAVGRWVRLEYGLASRRDILAEAGYSVPLTNPVEFLMRDYPGQPLFRYVQSHPDFDHMRGLAAVEAAGIQVINFWDINHSRTFDSSRDRTDDKPEWEAYERFRSGSNCNVLHLMRGAHGKYYNEDEHGNPGGNGLDVLSPTPQLLDDYDTDQKRNDLSYVIRYRTGDRAIIFGGDAEIAAWDSIHGCYGAGLKCDVLKASHHGRDSGFHLAAVKAMSPGVTIVSVGNKCDTDATVKYCNYSQSVLTTRWHGDITLTIDNNGRMNWRTSQQRNSRRAA